MLFKNSCWLMTGSLDGTDVKNTYAIGPRFKSFSDWLLKTMVSGNLEAIFPAATREYAPLVEELWKHEAIQATYNRRSELEMLPSVASYFLERVISSSDAMLNLSILYINNSLNISCFIQIYLLHLQGDFSFLKCPISFGVHSS